MPIKNKDFVKLNYTGRLKQEGIVFDTTQADVAKANNMESERDFGPKTICIGEGFLLVGLENALIGKEVGKHTIELTAEQAFGKKDLKLIKLFNTNRFIEQNVRPEPGMMVNTDGVIGIIKTVTGGRTTVDFNHPLAGKDVIYDVEVLGIIEEKKEKLQALSEQMFHGGVKAELKDEKAVLAVPEEVPEQIAKILKDKFISLVGVSDIVFEVKKPEK